SSSPGLWRAAFAQLAIIMAESACVVAVSEPLQQRLPRYFPRQNHVICIHNVPRQFGRSSGNKRRLLSLAKLEPRKNLELLCDGYLQYANAMRGAALPLTIAGDRGYCSYANKILAMLASIRARGFQAEFVE